MKVQVAKLDLTLPYAHYEGYEEILPAERLERIRRFRFEEDKIRSLAAGVLLQKEMMARGLSDTCLLKTGEHGKPYLDGEGAFYFSISHAGEYAALAVSEWPAGIDIEKVGLREKVAKRFYSAREQEEIRLAQGAEKKAEIFTRIWTGKEAFLKYRGSGLTDPIASIEVLDPAFWQKEKVFFSGMLIGEGAYYLTLCSERMVSVPDIINVFDFA